MWLSTFIKHRWCNFEVIHKFAKNQNILSLVWECLRQAEEWYWYTSLSTPSYLVVYTRVISPTGHLQLHDKVGITSMATPWHTHHAKIDKKMTSSYRPAILLIKITAIGLHNSRLETISDHCTCKFWGVEVGGCTRRMQTAWQCLGLSLEANWLALGGPFLSSLV